MMATGYSTLFSLGLSNIHTSFPRNPDSALSPSLSLSATPSTPSTSAFTFAPPKIHIDTQLPNLRSHIRRRRSSLTAAQSPLGNIGVKSPARAARTAAASPARTRHRRSESDAISRIRSNSHGDGLRIRRGPVRAPAPAPPNMPLPPVPAIPSEYASAASKHRTSSPVRPPSDISAHRRTCLSDKDCALNSNFGIRTSLPVPPSATSVGSHWSSPSMLLTPGFASKLAQALNTPPGSAIHSPNTIHSPVDPVLCSSYFEFTTPIDEDMKEN